MSLVTTFLVVWAYDIHNSEKFVSRKHIYEIVISEAKNAIVIVDNSGKISVFNRSAEKLFERNRVDVIGKDVTMLIPDKFRPNHQNGFEHATSNTNSIGSPYRHPANRMHPVQCYIVTKSGEQKRVLLDIRDIGDQMLAIIEEIQDTEAEGD